MGSGINVDSLSFSKGSTAAFGSDIVLYNQSGKVGIVSVKDGRMELQKTFSVSAGTNEHFAHPVAAGDRLYIRHGDVLSVYDYGKLKEP